MRETGPNGYKARLIKKLERLYPDAFILANDSAYIQGVPDLLVLNGDRWGALEVKRSAKAAKRPNQDWYVETWDRMSFAAFIFPENEEEVLDALQSALEPRRSSRFS